MMTFPLLCDSCDARFIPPAGGFCRLCGRQICTGCLRAVLAGSTNPCQHRLYQPTRFSPFRLSFTARERAVLSQDLSRWEALYFGDKPPATPVETHFLHAANGKVRANSPIESAFLKLLLIQQLTKRLPRVDHTPADKSKLEGLLRASAAASTHQRPAPEPRPRQTRLKDRSRPTSTNPGIPEHDEGVPRGDWYSDEAYYRVHPDRRPRGR